jgi:hypothetical protein
MNNLAISPYLFMYALQLQNIKRETSKKIPVDKLNQNREKKLEPKEELEQKQQKQQKQEEQEEQEEQKQQKQEQEETSTKIEDLVQNQVPSFEVKTEN